VGLLGSLPGDQEREEALETHLLKIIVVVIERIIRVGIPLNLFSSTFFLHELLF
jgi:hypothetical protein